MYRLVEVLVDEEWLEATLMQSDRDLDGLKNGRAGWWGRVRYHHPGDAPFCRRQELVFEDRLRRPSGSDDELPALHRDLG